ncbi:TORTIFOLIA1-like protein 4 isoform X1 [Actinidia eriantha]|uniref:TORTIFOLIA1-like protein 4 isoform X1 n=1 Tax=Actinidia eriantha TaxID=165200 RepID=UPI0025858388|nr:TORTIFOLIA1-like protein 4 isoform X1 [Actinidia eriantha]
MPVTAAASTRELQHRVLACLHKLSDRDTHSSAAAELDSIASTLPSASLPPFLSSISATAASDRSPVRTQCLRLISLLSQSHGDALSPHLSKLLSAVLRRLRDPDSAVRSACVAAASSIASHITKPPFTSILKPLLDSLVTEQDHNAQIGAALCLAAAIDASPDPNPPYLKNLLPRLEKLLRSDCFKAKPAMLMLIGSIIDARAASNRQVLKNLVPCLVEFIGSEDWAARKAAAEALVKLATAEGDLLAELKSDCLKTFEAKKFDKVKIVRETMHQLVEVWKEIPDVSDEVSSPPQPQSSAREDASDGRYPPGSKTSSAVTSQAPQTRKKNIPANRTCSPNGSAARNPLDSTGKKSGQAIFRKLDRQKPTNRKIETWDDNCSDEKGCSETGEKARSRFTKPEAKRALFKKNDDDKKLNIGSVKAGSRVVPCHVESSGSTAVVSSSIAEDIHSKQKECEDLSLIRKQLVNIENQQSSLLDLLQKFMGSSQNGMRSLERRVHGLELALDEISYDLAVTTGRMSKINSEGPTCCKLPGAEFLSPKFWRRTEPGNSTPQFPLSRGNKNGNAETLQLENRRFQLRGSGGLTVNPLAEVHSDSHGISEVSSSRVSKSLQVDA